MSNVKITFLDCGQDFLEWTIDDENVVIECKPFQEFLWKGEKVAGFGFDDNKNLLVVREVNENGKKRYPTIKYPVLKHSGIKSNEIGNRFKTFELGNFEND